MKSHPASRFQKLRRSLAGRGLLATAIIALWCAAGAPRAHAQGPLSEYYLTAGDNGFIWSVQGNHVVTNWSEQHLNRGEYAVAVNDAVRTLGNGTQGFSGPSELGSAYSTGGAYLNVDYTYPVVGCAFFDGTTDGTYNYSVDYKNGGVYRFDSNWANPTKLFDTPAAYLGITYDSATQSLWISQWDQSATSDVIENRSLNGALISSFVVPFSRATALAYDPADGSLWMGSQLNKGTFYQFSEAGQLLGSETYTVLVSQNVLGGEFGPETAVPEMSTWPVCVAAGLMLAVQIYRARRFR